LRFRVTEDGSWEMHPKTFGRRCSECSEISLTSHLLDSLTCIFVSSSRQ